MCGWGLGASAHATRLINFEDAQRAILGEPAPERVGLLLQHARASEIEVAEWAAARAEHGNEHGDRASGARLQYGRDPVV